MKLHQNADYKASEIDSLRTQLNQKEQEFEQKQY